MLLIYAAVAALTFAYYSWVARSAGDRYYWKQDLPGYYNYLGRAFAMRQLHLPVEPPAALLALKDPWDPAANASLRLHDAVLYKRRYFLYHGAAPAVILFAPWRILTGYDFPENFAVVAFCFGGWLFLSATLMLVLGQLGVRVRPGTLAMMLLVLAVATGVPYLLVRVWVYEVAIACGYLGAAGSLFFLTCAIVELRSVPWAVLAG
ncbi:MAG TPA: hypothetical protein VES20_21100, partial [Bryobacteraceae bacterium]|nr:hypothetical protein [Bryobacteraceae bacterium]